jgi:3-hydroxybutyryl-CoA dehydratase
MRGKTIHEMRIGDQAQFTKTISESDVYLYAGVTGDLNPAHIDEEYAKGTFFKTRIAHGMLTAGLISTVLGTLLPGPGTIYLRQEVSFLAPVRIGETVTARATVIEKNEEKNRVKLETVCLNQEGTKVVDGVALVSPPKQA